MQTSSSDQTLDADISPGPDGVPNDLWTRFCAVCKNGGVVTDDDEDARGAGLGSNPKGYKLCGMKDSHSPWTYGADCAGYVGYFLQATLGD